MVKQEPVGILRRIWNDAVLGDKHANAEYNTPRPVSIGRSMGVAAGGVAAIGTMGAAVVQIFGIASLGIPALPTLLTTYVAAIAGAGVYGALKTPQVGETKSGNARHAMSIVHNAPTNAIFKVVETPFRVAGYAVHALNTAIRAAAGIEKPIMPTLIPASKANNLTM